MKNIYRELNITTIIILVIMLTITILWALLLAIPVGKSIYENCSVYSSSDTMDKHVCTSIIYYTQK